MNEEKLKGNDKGERKKEENSNHYTDIYCFTSSCFILNI